MRIHTQNMNIKTIVAPNTAFQIPSFSWHFSFIDTNQSSYFWHGYHLRWIILKKSSLNLSCLWSGICKTWSVVRVTGVDPGGASLVFKPVKNRNFLQKDNLPFTSLHSSIPDSIPSIDPFDSNENWNTLECNNFVLIQQIEAHRFTVCRP